MREQWNRNWREYLIEAALIGIFMISAGLFGTLLEYPQSSLRIAIGNDMIRRALMGIAMGTTAALLIYSPWGKRSGAHMNPATTITFLQLGKVHLRDALWYTCFQFVGAIAGVSLVTLMARSAFVEAPVSAVATLPGYRGALFAFMAELVIAFFLMLMVLIVSNCARTARYTGLCVAGLVATYITFEAPISGMSLNPARTLASAIAANNFTAVWIYFLAPPTGMLLAAFVYMRVFGSGSVFCAKLHHQNSFRCIFCEYQRSRGATKPSPDHCSIPVS